MVDSKALRPSLRKRRVIGGVSGATGFLFLWLALKLPDVPLLAFFLGAAWVMTAWLLFRWFFVRADGRPTETNND